MSVSSSSTDPVQTVIDLLSGTAESTYPNGTKPDPIENRWASSRDEKRQRDDPAAYVYSPDIGEREQLSTAGETKDQTEVIDVEVWARDSDDASTIADDVASVLEDYWNDKQANTQFDRIRPRQIDDRRGERSPETTMGRRTNQYIVAVRVDLRREASIGTS